MAGKTFQVNFEINGRLTGQLASAIAAAQKSLQALKNSGIKTSAAMIKDMEQAARRMAELQKISQDAQKYQLQKKETLQNKADVARQQQATDTLSAKYKQEQAAAAALAQALERLKQARLDNKNLLVEQQNALKSLKPQQVSLQAQIKGFKGDPAQLAALQAELSKTKSAIESQKAAIASTKAEYASLGEQAKKTAADLAAANKALKTTGNDLKSSQNKLSDSKKSLSERLQKNRNLRDSLLARGFNPAQLADSLAALNRQIHFADRDNKILLSQAAIMTATPRSNIRNVQQTQDLKTGNTKRGDEARALSALNVNEPALRRARYELSLRNSTNIPAVKQVAPFTEQLTQSQKLTSAISNGKYFGEGLERLQQVLGLSAAYQNLSREFRENHQLYQKIGATSRSVENQQQRYSATISNLRSELDKYTAAYNANKKNLEPTAAKNAAEKIKAITAEIAIAEKTLAQLGKNLDASNANKQTLRGAMQSQMQQLRQLKATLSSEGFNTASFSASEQKLRADIEATTRAMERQAQVQELLNRYSTARKSAQSELNAQKATALKIQMQQSLQNLRALSGRINLQGQWQQFTGAQSTLNRNLNEMLSAWQNLQRLNSAQVLPVKKVSPQDTVTKAVGKIVGKINTGNYFGEGINRLNQTLALAQAYKSLTREMIDNRKSYQDLNRQTLQARRAYQQQEQAISKLRNELGRYTTAFKSVEKSLKPAAVSAAQQNIKAMTAEITAAEKVLAQLGKRLETLGGNRSNMSSAVSAQIQLLRQLQNALKGAGFSTQSFGASETSLRGQIDSTTRAIERQAALIERLNTAQNNFNDAQRNYQAAKDFANTIMSPFTSSVEVAKDFEHQMSIVKALSQMDYISEGKTELVNQNMAALTTRAKIEGLRTQYSALDAAKAETYLAYAGWDSAKIEKALPHMLDLASAAGMQDLGRVADITSDIMMAFHMADDKLTSAEIGKQAQRFADVLSYTVTHSNQNLEQLYETMKYAAPIAVGFGSSFEETAAMTKFMVDSGVKGSMAGTSMRAIMTRLVAPPKTITKTLQDNGLTLDDANKAWVNANEIAQEYGIKLNENATAGQQMAAVIRQINTNLKDMTAQEKMGIFKAITGLYGLSGGMNLFEHGGAMVDNPEKPGEKITALELFTRKLEQSGGSAKQTADVQRDNYWGQMKILEAAVEGLQIELGGALTPTLKVVASAASGFVQSFTLFAQAHPQIVQGAAAIAAGLSAIAISATGAALAFAAFELVGAQIALFTAGMAGADVATAGFAARLGMLARAFKGLAIWGTLAPLLKFSGWGKIGAGIAGAFAGLRGAGIAGLVTMLSGKIVGAAKSAVTAIKGIATAFRVATVAGLSFIFSPIGAALAALALTAYAVYKNWGSISPVFESLSNTMSARLSPAIDAMTRALDGAAKAWGNLFNIKTDGATDLLARGFIAAAKIISQVMLAIVHFVANSVASIASLFGTLGDAIQAAVDRDPKALKAAASKLNDAAQYAYSALVEPARDILAIPEEINKADSFFLRNKEAARIAQNSKAITKVDRMTGDIYTEANQKARQRHALKYDAESKSYHSEHLDIAAINAQAEAIKTAELRRQLYLPTAAAMQRHRQDATPQTLQTTVLQNAPKTPAYSYTPGNYTLPQMSITPPQLHTEQAQAQINALGTAAQNNSTTLQATDSTAQILNAGLQNANVSAQLLTGTFNTNNSAVMLNSTNFATNTSSVMQNSAAMQVSVGSINSMSGAASNSTGSISSLGGASANTAGSVAGLGSAAQSAIASLLNAGASAAASIGNVVGGLAAKLNISQNAKGGIYNHGAFLTWFAEKSPEAAIPLDGSKRAVNLWQTAGQLLGVYPAENYNGGIYKNGGQSLTISNVKSNNGDFDVTFKIENLDDLSKSIKTLAQVSNQAQNIISPPNQKKPNLLEEIFTPSSIKGQRQAQATLDAGRANLPEKVRRSKSFEALYKPTAQGAPEAMTAPQRISPTQIISKVLKGDIAGAISTYGRMRQRDMEHKEWEKQQGGVKSAAKDLPLLHAATTQSRQIISPSSTKKKGGSFFDKIFGFKPKEYDELGNIKDLNGIKDNVIMADDDNSVIAAKKAAQEKEYKKKKRQQVQKTVLNTVLGIGGGLLLGKVFKGNSSGNELTANILGGVVGKIFGGGNNSSTGIFKPEIMKNIITPPNQKQPNLIEEIFTPSSIKGQRQAQATLDAGRANLPEKVRRSKSFEALYKPTAQGAPEAMTAPQRISPIQIISKVLKGDIAGAISTYGRMRQRDMERKEWEKQQGGAISAAKDLPLLHAATTQSATQQMESVNSTREGDTFRQLETSTNRNANVEMPPISLNFTINIQGNASKDDVEAGVKQTIPIIQESFESQFKRFIGERSRRAFL